MSPVDLTTALELQYDEEVNPQTGEVMTRYWLIWFCAAFGTFIVPETVALVRNRTQDTLSGAVWKLEEFKAGQPISGWSAGHLFFTGVFTLMTLWLIGHFGFGWWR